MMILAFLNGPFKASCRGADGDGVGGHRVQLWSGDLPGSSGRLSWSWENSVFFSFGK